jgi:ligand-binding sensor domain-containing protein/signal transduction histidine kinase
MKTLMATCLCMVMLACQAMAGNGRFLHAAWQTSDALPHNSLTATLQDRKGYLWVATQSGVARFDGVKFETFRHSDGLPANRALCLMEDRSGRLWAGTNRGAAYRENGIWTTPRVGWPQSPVWAIAQAADGAVWLGTEAGTFRSRSSSIHPIEADVADPDVRALAPKDDSGAMWLLFRAELYHWSDGEIKEDEGLASLAAGRELWDIGVMKDGSVWVCGQGLLAQRDPTTGIWRDRTSGMPDKNDQHIDLCGASDGTLWVATRNRGLRFLRNGNWGVFGIDQGLTHDDVRNISIDRENNLWVSTNGGGLSRLSERRLEVFGRDEGLGRQTTTGLALDASGTLWAATDGQGILKFDGTTFQPGLPDGTARDGYIWSILAARDGALMAGTFRHGVLRWHEGKATWIDIKDGLASNWIPSLMQAADGTIWIGTHNGGVHLWTPSGMRTLMGHSGGNGVAITQFLESSAGDVWIATAGKGLFCWRENAMLHFDQSAGLPNPVISALHEDRDGKLWIGTGGGGLLQLTGTAFTTWTTDDGLVSDDIQQIQSDTLGKLWLGTDSGLQSVAWDELFRVRKNKLERVAGITYSRPDGLPTPQFTGGHGNLSLRDSAGNLWFSLAAGAVRVNPKFTATRAGPAPIHIESIASQGEILWQFERHPHPVNEAMLVLPAGAAGIQFRFTATQLRAPEKLRFRHRLHGLDNGWQDAGTERATSYASLPPGNYTFEVSATNHDGVWNEAGDRIAFRVRPHFWQTSWFRAAALLGSFGILTMAVRAWSLRRMRHKLRLLREKRRIDKERSRIARDLHDDLGTSLTEINFLGTLACAGANSASRERLQGIVERARRMAKSLDEIVWTVNPANDSLASTVSYLTSRTRESLDAAGIRSRFDIPSGFPQMQLDSERRHHLLMAVNEAVNNIMKHSGASVARLALAVHHECLEATIEDDGCGFDPAKLSAGRNGLENIRRRMESAGGRAVIESSLETGTRIHLTLPLSAAARVSTTTKPSSYHA